MEANRLSYTVSTRPVRLQSWRHAYRVLGIRRVESDTGPRRTWIIRETHTSHYLHDKLFDEYIGRGNWQTHLEELFPLHGFLLVSPGANQLNQ